jgi:hypothetical protein
MPALSKLKIGALTLVFVVAWFFFTPPGRRTLEKAGFYRECAAEVWSLRKNCASSQIEETAESPQQVTEPSVSSGTAPPLPETASPQPPLRDTKDHDSAMRGGGLPKSQQPATRELAETTVTDSGDPIDNCMRLWNRDTHMEKKTWRASCLRLQSIYDAPMPQ